MTLPKFNEAGDLPEGIHRATFDEVIARFGVGFGPRATATARLQRIFELAIGTGYLGRFINFGSYVSDKSAPNDVDVILVMQHDFRPSQCTAEALALFDHQRATAELGASIFWIRPDMLLGTSLEEFIAHWQVKRDGERRGIVEVI